MSKKTLRLTLLAIFLFTIIYKPVKKYVYYVPGNFILAQYRKACVEGGFTYNKIERYFTSSAVNNNAERKYYVINLASAPHKMEAAQRQFDKYGIKLERFEAVNGYKTIISEIGSNNSFTGADLKANSNLWEKGKKYNIYCYPESYQKNEPDFIYKPGKKKFIVASIRELSAGEIGLNCSARKLWQKIASSKDDQIAAIFEDDVVLSNNFDKKLEVVYKALPQKWDIIYLGHDDNFDHTSTKEETSNQLIELDGSLSITRTHAYMVNRASAKKMVEVQEKYYVAKPLDGVLDEATRSFRINTYITEGKIAGFNEALESDISAMGNRAD